jgi:dihydroorotate dehydrogenase (fumarate)
MNLNTSYLGLSLPSPLVASASPLSRTLDNFRKMEDAGAAAIVMFSLFEEQIRQEQAAMEHLMAYGGESFSEALSYFPPFDEHRIGPDQYLDLLHRASESVQIPVIGSLNGVTSEGWIDYARKMQEAGARAIELNVYYIPADLQLSGREVELRYLGILKTVKGAVRIPVAMKLSPFFSAMAGMARELAEAGADGLVLFNRFYQPDFDIEALEVAPSLNLSTPYEIRLPLMWIAILYGRVRCSLAASRGVHSGQEVAKYLLAGADVVMTTSALLKNGIEHLETLRQELVEWMERKEYHSVEQMKGAMSQRAVADPAAFERANYIKVLDRYKNDYVF